MTQESNNTLGERLARLEANQKNAAERAAEDRVTIKEQMARMHADLAEAKESINEVTTTLRSAVDQITGGRKVLHALYVTGAALAIVTAWASGLIKTLAAFFAR
ncbi:MAG: hypothetical protein ACK4NE_00185 [Albidovulum sp.]